MKANLHFHSRYSDGLYWPEELVIKAKKLDLDIISLTDHDNLAGTIPFLKFCEQHNILGIAGVEIDCQASEFDFDKELLGYFPNFSATGAPQTQKLLQRSLQNRLFKLKHYLKKAKQEFTDQSISYQDYLSFRQIPDLPNTSPVTFTHMKPNLYTYLRNQHIISSTVSFNDFKKFYTEKWDVQLPIPSVETVIEAIQNDGGYVVVPHLAHEFGNDSIEGFTADTTLTKAKEFLQFCYRLGVWGVELYYYKNLSNKENDQLNQLIKKSAQQTGFQCFTYGSDFHGHDPKDTLNFFGEFKGFT